MLFITNCCSETRHMLLTHAAHSSPSFPLFKSPREFLVYSQASQSGQAVSSEGEKMQRHCSGITIRRTADKAGRNIMPVRCKASKLMFPCMCNSTNSIKLFRNIGIYYTSVYNAVPTGYFGKLPLCR